MAGRGTIGVTKPLNRFSSSNYPFRFPDGAPLLDVQNLTRLFIGPVSFHVADGECVAITGPSGAGKSVLMRAIVDLDPNTGDVRTATLDRAAASAPEWRRRVGMLPAESGWWLDHVGPHFRDPEATGKLPPALNLNPEAMAWEVARLSTGERHRLALLRALEIRPEVLLLDEPTAALDQASTAAVEALLKTRLAEGLSILMVTHDPDQPRRMADRQLHLEDGRLQEVG